VKAEKTATESKADQFKTNSPNSIGLYQEWEAVGDATNATLIKFGKRLASVVASRRKGELP
jgi:hypothetical protein